MIYSAYKLNKQGDNIPGLTYSFPYLVVKKLPANMGDLRDNKFNP